ncbi:hypothetical protein R3P38DRAFT_2774090 [Favolaschia claudopus]|uniref:Uncharacterized protein n=1 Tax=Favolaschia claudopus TaxID=2862362 RepID=A0AAW0BW74_9AGAR
MTAGWRGRDSYDREKVGSRNEREGGQACPTTSGGEQWTRTYADVKIRQREHRKLRGEESVGMRGRRFTTDLGCGDERNVISAEREYDRAFGGRSREFTGRSPQKDPL